MGWKVMWQIAWFGAAEFAVFRVLERLFLCVLLLAVLHANMTTQHRAISFIGCKSIFYFFDFYCSLDLLLAAFSLYRLSFYSNYCAFAKSALRRKSFIWLNLVASLVLWKPVNSVLSRDGGVEKTNQDLTLVSWRVNFSFCSFVFIDLG